MALQAEVKLRQRLERRPGRGRVGPGLGRGLSVVSLMVLLWAGYVFTGRPVSLVIDGHAVQLRSQRLTVEAVLQKFNVTLEPEDIVQPSPGAQLLPGQTITVQLARPVTVDVDGRTIQRLTQRRTAGEILAGAGITLNARDELLIDGVPVSNPAIPLPPPSPAPADHQNGAGRLLAALTPGGVMASARPQPVRLIVHRAIPVTLNDHGASSTFFTTRPNVGEALLEQGLTLFLGDIVTPGLGARLAPGMRIYIQRSTPVNIIVDGRTIKTRTHRETVGAVLAQAGIALMGQDFSRPSADQAIAADDAIEVVRVREAIEIEQALIPFETNWVPDPDLEIDRQEIREAGATGVIKTRTRVRYENDQEVWREIEDEWLDQEPRQREIAYGTHIVVRTLETATGPVEYWRKIPMVVTAYSAATSGKAPDHPRYGITRSGLVAGFGIVAVDPKVVPLLTDLYIPEYGRAVAGDTGGLIQGKRVDLGYEDDQLPASLYEWRDVYVLTPAPSPDQIRYVLPEWPQR